MWYHTCFACNICNCQRQIRIPRWKPKCSYLKAKIKDIQVYGVKYWYFYLAIRFDSSVSSDSEWKTYPTRVKSHSSLAVIFRCGHFPSEVLSLRNLEETDGFFFCLFHADTELSEFYQEPAWWDKILATSGRIHVSRTKAQCAARLIGYVKLIRGCYRRLGSDLIPPVGGTWSKDPIPSRKEPKRIRVTVSLLSSHSAMRVATSFRGSLEDRIEICKCARYSNWRKS